MDNVKILAFDIFGTVVDWHGSIKREVEAINLDVDSDAFALAWRAGYAPAMKRVMSGELGWTKIDDLHRMILDDILVDFGVDHLTAEQINHLNRAWHRLDAWPDSVEGLTPTEITLYDLFIVEWQHQSANQYGQTCRTALGLHPQCRSF